MNRAKAMRRRELRGRKAGRLETKVPSMRNNARRTGAEVGAHHERALFPLASPSRSKSVRPHPDRPDRRLFPGGNPRAKLARACPHLLGARVRPTTRCGGKAQLVLPPACDGSTAQGTKANGPAQLVLSAGVAPQGPGAVAATICACHVEPILRLGSGGPAQRRAV